MVKQPSNDAEVTVFQEKLGGLGYFRASRFDLLHVVHQMSKFGLKPTLFTMKCIRLILGYLKGTLEFYRQFYSSKHDPGDFNEALVALADVSFANDCKTS